jgi:hypothetical protein
VKLKRFSAAAAIIVTSTLLAQGPVHSQEKSGCSEPPKVFQAQGRSATEYIADIDNDGTDERISTSEGRGLCISVSRAGSKTMRLPPFPKSGVFEDDGADGIYCGNSKLHASTNPTTRSPELLTRVCGKVYMSFDNDDGDWPGAFPARESYLWQNGAIVPACDQAWIQYDRGIFQHLYDAKYYLSAAAFLQGVVNQCGDKIEAKQRGWSYSDLALTEFHLGDQDLCLQNFRRAAAITTSSATPALAKALSEVQTLCGSGKGGQTPDPDWLGDPNLTDTSHDFWQPDVDKLLVDLVPDTQWGKLGRAGLRKLVKSHLNAPWLDKEVTAKRFVTLTNLDSPYYDHGMLWIDTRDKIGLFAINHINADGIFPVVSKEPDPRYCNCDIAIGSRDVTAGKIPTEFWQAYRKWPDVDLGEADSIVFIGADGKVEPISPPL